MVGRHDASVAGVAICLGDCVPHLNPGAVGRDSLAPVFGGAMGGVEVVTPSIRNEGDWSLGVVGHIVHCGISTVVLSALVVVVSSCLCIGSGLVVTV